jgi:hypothetical protein
MRRPSYPASADEERKSISHLLRELMADGAAEVSFDEVVDHFGHRAFAALLFVFAVPNLLPLPPGSTTVLGLPLVLIAPQLVIGVPNLWLPRAVGQRSMSRRQLARMFERILPRLGKLERLLSPRLDFVFGVAGDRMIGLVCTILAVILILPIPLGNILPALTIATLSLGLAQRDGLVALIGYGLAAASFGVLALTAGAVVAAAHRLSHLVGF